MFDVVGMVKLVPIHTSAIGVKSGVVSGVIPIVISTVAAHCPASGIKVYVVVVLGSKAGLQVPIIPLFDVVGMVKLVPIHTSVIGVKSGIVNGIIPIVIVV